jgi:peptidoglycan/LPS O-acetylase OafA/YrhL
MLIGFVVSAAFLKSVSESEIDRSIPFSDGRKWRDELHGIRGIAILLVVSFHIFGNGRVSGGIDIFLAITGFLAVPSLYRRDVAGGGFIPLMSRFGGLARRLLVPLVPVLLFIGIVGPLVLGAAFHPQLFTELRASVLFAENIELVRSQLAYDAAGPGTSALQHLWSTSIQVQFHILMPFVFMLSTVPLVKAGRDPKKALMIFLGIVTVGSFLYAWWHQGVFQQANYFSSISRLWELTLPGILGLTISKFRLNSVTRACLTWVGLIMLLSTGFLFDGASVFPGPQALLPVGGLLLFLTGGKSYTSWGGDRLVQIRPIKFLADISYSLYLWHWPVIIFYLNYFAKPKLGVFDALIVFTVSLALGTMGKKLFEDRVASLSLLKNNNVAVLLAITVMITGAGIFHWATQVSQSRLEQRL